VRAHTHAITDRLLKKFGFRIDMKLFETPGQTKARTKQVNRMGFTEEEAIFRQRNGDQ
jgi:hypothetical protein